MENMRVSIKDDFDLNIIINSGQCFRPRFLDNGGYRFITGNSMVDIFATDVENEYEVSCNKAEWENVWKEYFDLATNYASIRKSIPSEDAYMLRAGEIGAGIRILKQDKFEMLISFIISQRKSIPAIRSAVEKLCERYGSRDGDVYLFPTPEQLIVATEEELKDSGLGYRVSYVRDAVEKVISGDFDLEKMSLLSDEELFGKLKEIRGVGDKVANCVMLFAYHRVGRAPVDTWIAKVIAEKYDGVNPFFRYGDVAGIMQQYVFFAAQHEKYV